jgi:hypothetical protein
VDGFPTARTSADPPPADLRDEVLARLDDTPLATAVRLAVGEWHPDAVPSGDFSRGYMHALGCLTFAVAENLGIDTGPWRVQP